MSRPSFELKNRVIKAGAGAGKTTQLIQSVIDIFNHFQPEKKPQIVVCTFTRKATQELKERLLKKSMESASAELIQYVQSSALHISTIHGVLSQFLNQYGMYIGLNPQFSIITQSKYEFIQKKILKDLLHSNADFAYNFQKLSEYCNYKDILHYFAVYFEAKLQNQDLKAVEQSQLLDLYLKEVSAFSQKITEVCERISSETDNKNWAEFIESLQKLRTQFLGLLKSNQAKIDILDQVRLQTNVFLENKPTARKVKSMSESTIDFKDELLEDLESMSWSWSKDFFEAHAEVSRCFDKAAEVFNETFLNYQIRNSLLSMSDLENFSLLLINKEPSAAESFSKDWDYWFLDEYQDTSPKQVQILKHLIGDKKSYVVGDPQQSIYLFRGARSEVFHERYEQIAVENNAELKMENYRSRPEVLQFSNYLFSKLSQQFLPMNSKAKPPSTLIIEEAAQFLIHSGDEKIGEAEIALNHCIELLNAGLKPAQIAILARTNSDLEKIAQLAHEKSVPVILHASGVFWTRLEVRDALTLLKFICNPHDNINFLKLLRSPWFHLNDEEILNLCKKTENSYWSWALRSEAKEQPIIKSLAQVLRDSSLNGVREAWQRALISSGLLAASNMYDPTGRREANIWKLIHMLSQDEKRSGFSYFDFIRDKSVSYSEESSGDGDACAVLEPDRINMMTIHAAKGLEFDHVVIVGISSAPSAVRSKFFMVDEATGRWTLSLTGGDDNKMTPSLLGEKIKIDTKKRELAEMERVLYVAVTRAKVGVSLVLGSIEKNSLASKMNFILQNDGLVQEEGFSYRLSKKDFSRDFKMESKNIASLERFEKITSDEKSQTQVSSVTQILDDFIDPFKGTAYANFKSAELVKSIEKAQRGTSMHQLFENLKYIQALDQQLLSTSEKKAYKYLASWQGGIVLDIIKNGFVEFGFGFLHGEYIVQGQIDLWGRDNDGRPWILDYKTGSQRYKEKAFQQLEFYVQGLKKLGRINLEEKVKMAVIYPLDEAVFVKEI